MYPNLHEEIKLFIDDTWEKLVSCQEQRHKIYLQRKLNTIRHVVLNKYNVLSIVKQAKEKSQDATEQCSTLLCTLRLLVIEVGVLRNVVEAKSLQQTSYST